jgi:hypothetical protein
MRRTYGRFLLGFLATAGATLGSGCGGGGGGGGGDGGGGPPPPVTVRLVASMDGENETTVVDADAKAMALLEVRDDGLLRFAVAGEAAWSSTVVGLHVHRGAPGVDGGIEVDLLSGGASFANAAATAEGELTISTALAAELTADPDAFYVNVHTSAATAGLARGQLAPFQSFEWHARLSGAEEVPPASQPGQGAASVRVAGNLQATWVVAMKTPAIGLVTGAHVHVGAAGQPGGILLDLDRPSAVVDAAAGTATHTVAAPLATVARIALEPSEFHLNVHTAAAPNGAARGQLRTGTVEMWAELFGDQETDVVFPTFRGSAALQLHTLTTGNMMIGIPAATQSLAALTGAEVRAGGLGVDGATMIDLFAGPDLGGSESTGSAEGSITYDQKTFTRLVADPAAFHANLFTADAPLGAVRGQFHQEPLTFLALLDGENENPPADPEQGGTMLLILTGVHEASFTLSLTNPAPEDVLMFHVHDGAAGVNGPILIDLMGGETTMGETSITGNAPFTGRTFVRLYANAQAFYGNAHTAAFINGAIRGQLSLLSADSPPAGLSYSTPVTYETGSAITPNVPSSIGGAITSYSVSPFLPAGLSLHPTTGIISGTPTQVTAANNYTVTASNASGSTQAVVQITVQSGPTTSLSYSTPVVYVQNTAISPNLPSFTGGAPTSWSISPALPTGLAISASSGVISGTPTVTAAAANYTVTASNSAGSIQAVVNVTVNSGIVAPSGLSYSTPVSYPTGYAITPNNPTFGGGTPTSWSISPALPAGLLFNTANGSITGTPTTVTAAANYTVTAGNSAGSTQATVNVAVVLGAPANLSYSNTPNIGYVTGGSFATMNPTVSGGAVASYSISPALPPGISLNTSTGVISGSPTTTSSQTTYTVTATNAAGSTQASIQITVLP